MNIPQLLNDYHSYLSSESKTQGTNKDYLYEAERLLEYLQQKRITNLRSVTTHTVNCYFDFLQEKKTRTEKMTGKTLKKIRSILVRFFDFLICASIVDSSPVLHAIVFICVEKESPFYILPEHYAKIQESISNKYGKSDSHFRAFMSAYISLLYNCGLRRCDALALKWSDVNLLDGYIRCFNKKNNTEMVLRINQDLDGALRTWMMYYPSCVTDSLVFSLNADAGSAAGVSISKLSTEFQAIVIESGVIEDIRERIAAAPIHREFIEEATSAVRVTFHTFRHSYITQLIKSGKTAQEVSNITLHSSADMISKYHHNYYTDFYSTTEARSVHLYDLVV